MNYLEVCSKFNLETLREANLYSADMSSADLSGVNLSSANLSGADLRYANLSDADLSRANLYSADLRDADLIVIQGGILFHKYLQGFSTCRMPAIYCTRMAQLQ